MLLIEVKDEDTSLDYPVHRIINDVLGVNGAWGAKAAHILADLIDPTCHDADHSGFEFKCSVCGAYTEIPTHMGAEIGWTKDSGFHLDYCPCCGARVVDDE